MTARYAYLILEPQSYRLEASSGAAEARGLSSSADHNRGGFPERLRRALDDAAKQAGYASLERSVGSVKTAKHPTPSRAAHVRSLVKANLLNEDDVVSRMMTGAVPDSAWSVLARISPLGGQDQRIPESEPVPAPKARLVRTWSLTLHTGDAVVSFPVDPEDAPGTALPLALTVRTLETLATEGWTVVQVSEDRAIDDAASSSRVIRKRFLLRQ